ncbi:MAG TPA: hypothetical protein PLV59_01545 [Candidatus Dojkabacteria bacterium]|nr:hypothetical protein [Candidatus Dojkabacteria bacterium]
MAESKGVGYLKIINGSVQNKTYSFAVFTVIVVIVLLVGAIRPTLLTITKINKDIEEKTLINEQLDSKLDNLARLNSQYSERNEDIEVLPLMFPTQGNFSLFMSNIETIAKSNGYTLNSITFGSPNDLDYKYTVLKPWIARITVTGNRSNIVKLLSAYESMPMYPIVNKLSFARNASAGGLAQFSVDLVIFRIDDPNFYN